MSDASPDPDLGAIERAGVHAWPAHRTRSIGGWLWRHSNGGSQRANSVATLGDPGMDAEAAIDLVERLYRDAGAPPQFQITDLATPSDLDRRLQRRGYAVTDRCLTIARGLAPDRVRPPGGAVEDRASDDWFETYASVITAERRAQARAILDRVPPPHAFCAAYRDGRMVATALTVLDGRTAIVECVATLPDARRMGAGRTAVQTALHWAAAAGATTAALGVVAANQPALALYRGLGFAEVGRYHMRFLR